MRMLDEILPVSPRRLGLLNDAAITSSLERYDLEQITAPTLALSVADDQFGRSPVRAIRLSTFPMRASSDMQRAGTYGRDITMISSL